MIMGAVKIKRRLHTGIKWDKGAFFLLSHSWCNVLERLASVNLTILAGQHQLMHITT